MLNTGEGILEDNTRNNNEKVITLYRTGDVCGNGLRTGRGKNDWHFNIGAMYEIENVEGYGEDMDGLAEPSVYFNAANGPWRISLAYYQEGPVDYSAGKRGTWFDRPELEVHYQFLESDDFSFGLTGGFRNYGYHYVDEPGKDTANMQRWKIAPDWDVKLTDDLRFNGWLSMYICQRSEYDRLC